MKVRNGTITIGRDVGNNRMYIGTSVACLILTPSQWERVKKTGDTEAKKIRAQRGERR